MLLCENVLLCAAGSTDFLAFNSLGVSCAGDAFVGSTYFISAGFTKFSCEQKSRRVMCWRCVCPRRQTARDFRYISCVYRVCGCACVCVHVCVNEKETGREMEKVCACV